MRTRVRARRRPPRTHYSLHSVLPQKDQCATFENSEGIAIGEYRYCAQVRKFSVFSTPNFAYYSYRRVVLCPVMETSLRITATCHSGSFVLVGMHEGSMGPTTSTTNCWILVVAAGRLSSTSLKEVVVANFLPLGFSLGQWEGSWQLA